MYLDDVSRLAEAAGPWRQDETVVAKMCRADFAEMVSDRIPRGRYKRSRLLGPSEFVVLDMVLGVEIRVMVDPTIAKGECNFQTYRNYRNEWLATNGRTGA